MAEGKRFTFDDRMDLHISSDVKPRPCSLDDFLNWALLVSHSSTLLFGNRSSRLGALNRVWVGSRIMRLEMTYFLG